MTTNDLSQLLDQKLKPLTNELESLSARLRTAEKHLAVISDKLSKNSTQVKKQINELTIKVTNIEKSMATKKDVNKLDRKLDKWVKHLDKNTMQDRHRLDRIENKLSLPKMDFKSPSWA